MLHALKYRTRYAEFLKIDFPRIPYPENPAVFHALAEKGAELRELHLMESPLLDKRVTTYPVDGEHVVDKIRFEYTPHPNLPPQGGKELSSIPSPLTGEGQGGGDNCGGETCEETTKTGRVYINATQYFGNVPEIAWNFYIGGYQPAQKWLKDRKGRNLSIDDIRHYQRIIIALTETPRIMADIDQIDFLPEDKTA